MLLIAAALVLSSCAAVTQLASSDNGQKFQDGIYNSSPALKSQAEKTEDQAATEALIEKTKASEIYLLGEKKDTIMIPDNFSARIQYDQKLGGTVITVGENPYDWRYDLENNYGYYYGPYSIGASWYWSRHYDPWYWDAWSYHSPWRFNRWHYHNSWYYDRWHYSGWYDPWYYGSAWGFYDPWYYGGWYGGWNPYHPYYAGWYGGIGWYPHHHHHHPGHIQQPGGPSDKNHFRGQRYQTGSERLSAGGGSSLRGGSSVRSTVSRNTSTVSTSAGSTSNRSTSGTVSRNMVNRTTATKVNSSSNAAKPASGTSVARTAPPGYRKPSASSSTSGNSNVQSSSSSDRNKTGQTYRSSSPQNSSSTPTRSQSSPTYQRSSSSSYNRSAVPSSSSSGSSMGRGSSSSGSSMSRGSSSGAYRR